MIVELFSEPLHRRYFAPRLSCAYLFIILCKIIYIVFPFLLSYRNGKIWLKFDKYLEQPDVRFTYKMILVLQTTTLEKKSSNSDDRNKTTTTTEPNEIFYSTIPDINAIRSNNVRVPSTRSREIDDDNDGLMDYFWLNALIPLLPGESVYELQAALIMNYKITNEVKLDFDSLAYIRHTSGLPSSSFYSTGQFNLQQKKPLSYRNTIASTNDVLLEEAPFQMKESNIHTLLEKSSKRDVFARYEELYSTSTRALKDERFYNMTVRIDIPTHQEIWYTPGVIEVLYYAWMKYLSLLVIVGYLLHKICSFIFFHQIVATKMDMTVVHPSKYD